MSWSLANSINLFFAVRPEIASNITPSTSFKRLSQVSKGPYGNRLKILMVAGRVMLSARVLSKDATATLLLWMNAFGDVLGNLLLGLWLCLCRFKPFFKG
jgi:hypothetical protein